MDGRLYSHRSLCPEREAAERGTHPRVAHTTLCESGLVVIAHVHLQSSMQRVLGRVCNVSGDGWAPGCHWQSPALARASPAVWFPKSTFVLKEVTSCWLLVESFLLKDLHTGCQQLWDSRMYWQGCRALL